MHARRKALLAVLAVAICLLLLFAFYGYNQTWQLWNIPVMSPVFADLRVITHGADSVALGLDPLINNPGDPWGRPLNYPRIWQSLYSIGINKSHTVGLGVGIIFCFLAGVVMVLPNARNMTIALVIAALVSPAILLGIERGNIDLFIFFLAASTIILARKSAAAGVILIVFGTALKLFPIFFIPVLLRMEKRRFLRHTFVILAISFIYIAVIWPELRLISKATPRATDLSYGINVAWMHMAQINPALGQFIQFMAMSLVFIAACLIFLACTQRSAPEMSGEVEDSVALDSFRLGASIYIGTFLLGNNWDYRLLFLILTIPQLSLWMVSASKPLRLASKIALSAMLISMWYLIIAKVWFALAPGFIHSIPVAQWFPFILDELSNWLLFLLLTYLFSLALPEWAKELFLSPLRAYVRR